LAVERQRAANHRRIAGVAPHPSAKSEQRFASSAGLVVVRREERAEQRTNAQHWQQIRRHADGADPLGLSVAGQVRVRADGNSYVLKALLTVPDVEVLRGREPVLGDAETGRRIQEDDLTVGRL